MENKYTVEAFVEMRGSEMGVRFGLKNDGSYFSRFGAAQAVQNKWLSVGSRLINVDWEILSHWEKLGAGTHHRRWSMVRSGQEFQTCLTSPAPQKTPGHNS